VDERILLHGMKKVMWEECPIKLIDEQMFTPNELKWAKQLQQHALKAKKESEQREIKINDAIVLENKTASLYQFQGERRSNY
jgi:hypothetical protein